MMSGSARCDRLNLCRLIVATVVAIGFVWMIALSVSPELHASVHAEAADMAHHCGATLLASGSCQDAPAALPVASPILLPALTPMRVVISTAQAPFLVVRILEHAPPAAA